MFLATNQGSPYNWHCIWHDLSYLALVTQHDIADSTQALQSALHVYCLSFKLHTCLICELDFAAVVGRRP